MAKITLYRPETALNQIVMYDRLQTAKMLRNYISSIGQTVNARALGFAWFPMAEVRF